MSEWRIENAAIVPCKISAFSKKYFLNKILSMRIVVLYKYITYTVDKTTSTGTCHTIYIYLLHCITRILLLILGYYLLAPIGNF